MQRGKNLRLSLAKGGRKRKKRKENSIAAKRREGEDEIQS